MILAVDAGNTRIKWGLTDGAAWAERGAAATGQPADLDAAWACLARPHAMIVSNVAGKAAGEALRNLAARWALEPRFIASRGVQCGVRSSYEDPAQLGCDRWAALIGAWRLSPRASLVVNAGTAMTVDALSGEGLFVGGVIAPGLDLMRRALDRHTAALRYQPGEVRFFPGNTGDAIMSGAAHALAGAIERMANFLREAGEESVHVMLSGGDAAWLRPLLALETVHVENLVLEGLAAIALDDDAAGDGDAG